MGGPAGMGYPGMMGGDSLSPIRNLQLSKRQREKLDAISEDLSERKGALLGQIATHNEKLRALGDEQRRLTQAISDLQRQVMQADTRARGRAEEMLSSKQRQQLQQAWRPQQMPSPRMAPGRGQRGSRSGGSSFGMGGG